ncbi:MAG: DUF1989 domain-containing protein [Actinobacteria bacterium]|nr:DUF1989 domain-containing protein [Actinomycetota bacterium]
MAALPPSMRKHPVEGRVLQEWILPAKGYCAFTLRSQQVLRVVDLEGKQVTDIVVFNSSDHGEEMSLASSLLMNRQRELRKGAVVYSQICTPMMTITGYSNEVSFAYGSMCSEELNRLRYGIAGTTNCRDNLAQALTSWGFNRRDIPNAFSPFMRVDLNENEELEIMEPASVAGDFYDMRAEMDLLVGISNCPQELNACNGYRAKPSGVIIYETE